MKKSHAFTLIELMITLGVFAILASIAVPSFITTMQNSNMITNTNNLVSAFRLARSEAIKLRDRVSVCPSSNSTAALPSCSGTSWETGWVVWHDSNGSDGIDAGETILRVESEAAGTDTTIRGDVVVASVVSFVSNGMPQTSAGANLTGTLRVCDSRGLTNIGNGDSDARAVVILASGRIRATNSLGAIPQCP